MDAHPKPQRTRSPLRSKSGAHGALLLVTVMMLQLLHSGFAPAQVPPASTTLAPDLPQGSGYEMQRFEARRLVPDPGALRITNSFGDVRLRRGGERHSEAVVLGVLQQFDGQPRLSVSVDETPQGLVVEVREATQGSWAAPAQGPSPRVDLVVFVPEQVALEVRVADGLIDARKTLGDLNVRQQAGALRLRSVDGDLDLEAGSAEVQIYLEARSAPGQQRIETTSGDIWLHVNDHASLRLLLHTAGLISTDYTMSVAREPVAAGTGWRKRAELVVGKPVGTLEILSEVGRIRVLRRLLSSQARAR